MINMLPARISGRRSGPLSHGGKRSLLDDDFFTKLAQEASQDEEVSDVSEADPMALVESMKDTDDMDADLFWSTKTSRTTAQSGVKTSADGIPKTEVKPVTSSEMVPPARTPQRDALSFDDDEDDLMEALGFGESPQKKGGASSSQRESNASLTAQNRLDEILFPQKPPHSQGKDLPEKSLLTKDPGADEDDLIFGSYQPTLSSSVEGRQSRRQSVRFSTEDISILSPERKRPSAAAAPPSSVRSGRSAADWLGLKQEDPGVMPEDLLPEMDSPKPRPSSPAAGTKTPPLGSSSLPGAKPAEILVSLPNTAPSLGSPAGPNQTGEDDWLAGALTRKKSRPAPKPEGNQAEQPVSSEFKDQVDLDAVLSQQDSAASVRKLEETPASSKDARVSSVPREAERVMPAPPQHPDPPREDQLLPAAAPHRQLASCVSLVPQLADKDKISAVSQFQLTQPVLERTESAVESAFLCTQRGDVQHRSTELASLAHRIQLETQIRSLQLERDHAQALLQSVQRRNAQDMELLESRHRASMKLLDDALAEREARWQQESEELMERLTAVMRHGEQERAELETQNQRRLSQFQQDRDAEVRRLQELQRKSIEEMKRDHDLQVQRLKRLKDEEIDAVTSATSQTRSVSVVMEQMDHLSRRLGDLSSRMESSQEHSTQDLQQSMQSWKEQFRVLQEHLSQQERAMAEERSRLKELIAKMEAQLSDQQRQLEKERWRATADQAKAESAQRALEEERRSLTQRMTMEREELERAKSALLEEQQSVMQHCAEERRRLAAEWAQFHAQERMRQDRAEQESRRALKRDVSREGSIITMAQDQADLRLRAGELRQREEEVSRQKEALQRQHEEQEQERERLSSAAARLKARALELEGFSQLASEKHEEGQRALQEARKIELEHRERLGNIHTQMERLRLQEQHLHQEQMKMADHHREAEGVKQRIPITSLPPYSTPFIPDLAAEFGSAQRAPSVNASLPSSVSAIMQAQLALVRNNAQKDRDFLQDEQFFLETLKKAPCNPTLHSA
ncbi:hypothetical protein GJAV_G00214340 [Gymnothorax javanicus]|nr:hypothetical protein GJAV_G00214340 [Gymnothorax javanicus]